MNSDEFSLYNRVIGNLEYRRQKLLSGKINSIPSPFTRFSEDFIGIEASTYYCLTSSTKGGKSQLASRLFIYEPLMFAFNNRDKVRVKIFYFNLE